MTADQEEQNIDDYLDRWENLFADGKVSDADDFFEKYVRPGELPRKKRELLRETIEKLIDAERAFQIFHFDKLPHSAPISPAERGASNDPAFSRLTPGIEIVPGYRLDHRIASGGFGEVWKGTGLSGFPVALKLIPRSGNKVAVEKKSFDLLKEIRHPNILAIFDAWENDDFLVIAMQLADESLMDRFHAAAACGQPSMNPSALLPLFREAALALDYLNMPKSARSANREPMQHGDIKPQNILISGGSVLLGDLGLARALRSTGLTPHSGSFTMRFAAPECFDRIFSRASDQYSLAVTWYFLRTGLFPFERPPVGFPRGSAETLSPSGDLSVYECRALTRAMARDPADRYASCGELIDALQHAVARAVRHKKYGRFFKAAGILLTAAAAAAMIGLVVFRFWPWYGKRYERAGNEAYSNHFFTEAISEYDKALEMTPESVEALVHRAASNIAVGRLTEAGDDLNRAREIDPNHAETFYWLGRLALRLDEDNDELAYFQRAIELDPDYTDAYRALGELYLASGMTVSAFPYFNKAVELEPENSENLIGRAESYMTAAEALDDFAAAVLLKPDEADYYLRAIPRLVDIREFDAARSSLEKARSLYQKANNVDKEKNRKMNELQKEIDEKEADFGDDSMTLFDRALWIGDLRIVENLIVLGVDLKKLRAGQSPLHTAVGRGHLDLVKVLIDAGADPELKNEDGQTPLELARDLGRREIEKILKN